MRLLSTPIGIAIGALVSFCSNATTIKVLDEQGKPLQHAVVEVLGKPATTVTSNAIMDQVNKSFNPYVLTITQGQAVSFPNSDDIRHHVYSFSQTKPFELKLYHGTPSQPVVFDKEGIVVLGCNIHDAMVGYIYIAQSAQVFTSDVNGLVELPTLENDETLRYWHPEQEHGPEHEQRVAWHALKQNLILKIKTQDPTPRNTFGEKFKGTHVH
ncbi:Protein containing plastocyanin/azurin family domain [Pseudoalteromonas luteoviolacea B = ATCC 29581]|nr:Protein containing plastocyanin/azurin family domain [Pseudoalteromonas luteoviolacea B = ATCC 29581]